MNFFFTARLFWRVARLAALAAATNRKPVLPMLPCDSEWLKQFRCGDGCYGGVLERINLLAGGSVHSSVRICDCLIIEYPVRINLLAGGVIHSSVRICDCLIIEYPVHNSGCPRVARSFAFDVRGGFSLSGTDAAAYTVR